MSETILTEPHVKVKQVNLGEQMESAYLDYAMSVIIGRALPDLRDGLKPVHRRILYAMHDRGWRHDKAYVKCAKIVGEVIGNFHPHGDAAIYESLVRMAQDFSMNMPLIDGQGNFGSIDGDNPAAYRYTEARLMKIASSLLSDIDKETVDFTLNFDDTRKEPVLLPAAIPNLLVNGSEGIAVGMSTSIPPHNFNEVMNATIALLENPALEIKDLMKYIPAPDFPTGGVIIGAKKMEEAYTKGSGSVSVRAKVEIGKSSKRKRDAILISEIPYQVKKTRLLEEIAALVQQKKIAGIADIRDLSDRHGINVEMELKKDANPQVILNQLYKRTQLQRNYTIGLLGLIDKQPRVFNLKEGLEYFIQHRHVVIRRRTEYLLREAKKRMHILEGFKKALDQLDAVIRLIRASKTVAEAKTGLMEKFDLSDIQSTAVLEMRLQKLTSLEIQKIIDELKQIKNQIREYNAILKNKEKQKAVILGELTAANKENTIPRRSQMDESEEDISQFETKDLIADEEVMITLFTDGFIKRMDRHTFRRQNRGGRGIRGGGRNQQIQQILVANTHDSLLLFSNRGKFFSMPVHEIPSVSREGKGKSLKACINLSATEEAISTISNTSESLSAGASLVLITRQGIIKRMDTGIFQSVRKGGVIAMQMKSDDVIVAARLVSTKEDLLICTQKGNAARIQTKKVRLSKGRNVGGVVGIKLKKDDAVIGMEVIRPQSKFLVLSTLGYGKRVDYKAFTAKGRGTQGVSYMKVSTRVGHPICIASVEEKEHILIVTNHGITLRTEVKTIPILGRTAQGVRVVNIDAGHFIQGIAPLSEE